MADAQGEILFGLYLSLILPLHHLLFHLLTTYLLLDINKLSQSQQLKLIDSCSSVHLLDGGWKKAVASLIDSLCFCCLLVCPTIWLNVDKTHWTVNFLIGRSDLADVARSRKLLSWAYNLCSAVSGLVSLATCFKAVPKKQCFKYTLSWCSASSPTEWVVSFWCSIG